MADADAASNTAWGKQTRFSIKFKLAINGFTAFIDKPDYFLKFKFALQLIDS